MAQQQSQPEATETEVPAEGAAVAEGGDTSAAGAAAADTGAPAGDAGAAVETPPVEGEPAAEPTEEEKAKTAADEATLKTAAEKYAKEQIAQANRTMAAARRAERAAKEAATAVATENASLKSQVEVYGTFVKQLQTQPLAALGRLGFATVKDFIDHCVATGGDAKPLTEEQRLDALVNKKLEEREAPRKQQEIAAAIEASKKAVFAYIDEQPEKFDLVTTDVGHDRLWMAITSYHKKHGTVPDEAIDLLAEQVEKDLTAGLSKSKKFGQSQLAKNGTPASGAAAAGASSSGKTLAGKPTSGAPAAKKYSLDPDERTAQINEELRAEGLI